MPANGRRFVQRVTGYEATLVAGEPIFQRGEHTGAMLGRLVRAGRGDAALAAGVARPALPQPARKRSDRGSGPDAACGTAATLLGVSSVKAFLCFTWQVGPSNICHLGQLGSAAQ